MEIFPFTPSELQPWMIIGIVAGAVLGTIMFIGGIGGYILYALRSKPPT